MFFSQGRRPLLKNEYQEKGYFVFFSQMNPDPSQVTDGEERGTGKAGFFHVIIKKLRELWLDFNLD